MCPNRPMNLTFALESNILGASSYSFEVNTEPPEDLELYDFEKGSLEPSALPESSILDIEGEGSYDELKTILLQQKINFKKSGKINGFLPPEARLKKVRSDGSISIWFTNEMLFPKNLKDTLNSKGTKKYRALADDSNDDDTWL